MSEQATSTSDPFPDFESLDDVIEAFEDAWNCGTPALEDFLPPDNHPEYEELTGELLCVDLERRFRSGSPMPLEEYRRNFPELLRSESTIQRLAFEEYRLRGKQGDAVSPEQYQQQFGISTSHWPRPNGERVGDTRTTGPASSALARNAMADGVADEMNRIASVTQPLPKTGDTFLSFELVEQLGQCKFGSVFLARQNDLSDRFVVIKVTTNLWAESERLARLQHSNIVPIYSVHHQEGLQAVCMPFFGRNTLDSLIALTATASNGHQPSDANDVVDRWLEETEHPDAVPGEHLQWLTSLSLEQLCTWTMSRIAAGLSHAHERGILHRDLKPQNILVSDDLRPMILDFNLSDDVVSGGRSSLLIGGTLSFMAPEHLLAVIAEGEVDARSDIYSLGVIFYQLLTGELPFQTQSGSTISSLSYHLNERYDTRPEVTRVKAGLTLDVEAIVLKCLAANPAERYQTARELQQDLERHLRHLPLQHAPNRSVRERMVKWSRRHPALSSSYAVATIASVLLLVLAGLFVASRGRIDQLEAQQTLAEFLQKERAASAPLSPLVTDTMTLERGLKSAHAALKTYGAVEAGWQDSEVFRAYDGDSQKVIRESVRRMQYLSAGAMHRLAMNTDDPERRAEWLRSAIKFNALSQQSDRANHVSAAIALQRRDIESDMPTTASHPVSQIDTPTDTGITTQAEEEVDVLAALGRMREGKLEAADAILKALATQNPTDAYIHFLRGRCQILMDRPVDAEAHFTACIALWPDSYIPVYYRGMVRRIAGRNAEAIDDLTMALSMQPNVLEARLHRGQAYAGLEMLQEAVNDYTVAIDGGLDRSLVRMLRAEAYRELRREDEFNRDMNGALAMHPQSLEGWLKRAAALRESDKEAALDAYNHALLVTPTSRKALQNKAALLSQLQRDEEAIETLTRLLEIQPNSLLSLSGRAILHARTGNRDEAIADGESVLEQEDSASHHFQMARILAHTAKQHPDDLDRAETHLIESISRRPAYANLVSRDAALRVLTSRSEVKQLIRAAGRFQIQNSGKPSRASDI